MTGETRKDDSTLSRVYCLQYAPAPGSIGNDGHWVVLELGRLNILYDIPTAPSSGETPGGANIITTNNSIPSESIELSEPEVEPLLGQTCVCFNMRKTTRFITQFYDRSLKSTGLRVTQMTLMTAIRVLGPTSF